MDRTPSASSSRALTVPSKPQVSLNKQVVLEEDEYTEALSAIIARDFFPSLAPLNAINNHLSALESEDQGLINASVRRMSDLAAASATPYFSGPSETPLRTPRTRSDIPASKKPRYNANISLDEFQARYTSEDNASFTEILDEENKERKQIYAWAWNAEDRAMERKAKEIEGREQRLIEVGPTAFPTAKLKAILAGETKAITDGQDRPRRKLDPDVEYTSEEEVDMELDGEPLRDYGDEEEDAKMEDSQVVAAKKADEEPVDVMAPLKDKRSAAVSGWTYKTRNALMFPPDADESPYHPPPPKPTDVSKDGVRQDAPIIIHANTRLPEQNEGVDGSSSEPPSPTRSRIAAAISGTPYVSRSDSPKIRGFGFVDAVPSPSPSQLGPQGMRELMTLGTLLATPRIISGGDDSTRSPFVINAPGARDNLGRRLGSEAGRAISKRAGLLNGSSSTPRATPKEDRTKFTASTPRRLDILTPAARRLLDRTKGGAAASSSVKGGLLGGLTPLSSGRSGGSRKQLDLRKVGWDSPRSTR